MATVTRSVTLRDPDGIGDVYALYRSDKGDECLLVGKGSDGTQAQSVSLSVETNGLKDGLYTLRTLDAFDRAGNYRKFTSASGMTSFRVGATPPEPGEGPVLA